ncbi:hypothetical protein ACSFB8_08560 [Enterococcus faecalis]
MQKKYWVSVVLLALLLGGIGLFFYTKNEQQRKEQEVLQMELTTAKQIKNTFADVTKIEFEENYYENSLAGFTSVDLTISTSYGVTSNIGVSMSLNNKSKTLRSYAGGSEFKKGITQSEIKVILSNKKVRRL